MSLFSHENCVVVHGKGQPVSLTVWMAEKKGRSLFLWPPRVVLNWS